MKVKRKIIEINEKLCDGCGNCVLACAESAIKIINGKAKVISDNLCDGLGACLGDCPTNALKIVERYTDEFDENAVEKHLKNMKNNQTEKETLACGCPSTQIQEFNSLCNIPNQGISNNGSALTHWPVKIRLIPPTAPFLRQADLLVAADCVPVVCPDFHQKFLKNRIVMLGCPKFDDKKAYIEKFTEIFKTAKIKAIMCLIMEVPCCSGFSDILNKAMEKADINIDSRKLVINNKGKIIGKTKLIVP